MRRLGRRCLALVAAFSVTGRPAPAQSGSADAGEDQNTPAMDAGPDAGPEAADAGAPPGVKPAPKAKGAAKAASTPAGSPPPAKPAAAGPAHAAPAPASSPPAKPADSAAAGPTPTAPPAAPAKVPPPVFKPAPSASAEAAPAAKNVSGDENTPETLPPIPPTEPFLTAGAYVDEVMSQATGPHAYDWRAAALELEVGYDYDDEANNYDTDGWHLGVSAPTDGGFMLRLLIRRIYVHRTPAGDLIGRTPFRQAAQPTRYEVGLGGGWALLEGRSMTRLSPWLSDVQHVMLATFGIHYTDPNAGWIPKRGDDTGTLPGQKKTYSTWNLELGLRWQIYLPAGLGIFFEMDKNVPRTRLAGGLGSWQAFTSGAAWSFGGK